MTASDFDHAHGFLLTQGRSPYMRRLSLGNGLTLSRAAWEQAYANALGRFSLF